MQLNSVILYLHLETVLGPNEENELHSLVYFIKENSRGTLK